MKLKKSDLPSCSVDYTDQQGSPYGSTSLSPAAIETQVNLSCKPSPFEVHVLVIMMLLGSSEREREILSVYILSKHQKGGWINADDDYRKRPIEIRLFFSSAVVENQGCGPNKL